MDYNGRFTKQSAEQFPIKVNFSKRLLGSETISSIAVTAADTDGNDATSTVVASSSESGGIVTVNVKGGVDGTNYIITIRATTDADPHAVHEADILMSVVDVP